MRAPCFALALSALVACSSSPATLSFTGLTGSDYETTISPDDHKTLQITLAATGSFPTDMPISVVATPGSGETGSGSGSDGIGGITVPTASVSLAKMADGTIGGGADLVITVDDSVPDGDYMFDLDAYEADDLNTSLATVPLIVHAAVP